MTCFEKNRNKLNCHINAFYLGSRKICRQFIESHYFPTKNGDTFKVFCKYLQGINLFISRFKRGREDIFICFCMFASYYFCFFQFNNLVPAINCSINLVLYVIFSPFSFWRHEKCVWGENFEMPFRFSSFPNPIHALVPLPLVKKSVTRKLL